MAVDVVVRTTGVATTGSGISSFEATLPAVTPGACQLWVLVAQGRSTSLSRLTRPSGWNHPTSGAAVDAPVNPPTDVPKLYAWWRTAGPAITETVATYQMSEVGWLVIDVADLRPLSGSLPYAFRSNNLNFVDPVVAPAVAIADAVIGLHVWAIDAAPTIALDSSPLSVATGFRAVNQASVAFPAAREYGFGVAVQVAAGGAGLVAQQVGLLAGGTPSKTWGFTVALAEVQPGGDRRIRSHVSEDAGSIFAATQAVAVELGISEAFDFGEDVPVGVLRAFSEALTPDEVALRYYPLPTRNQETLVTVDGETNLGRMASTIPDALMLPASSIPGESGGVVTAQQAIQHVVDTWSSAYPWLVFEPIPDLRFVEPGAVGDERQYYVDNTSAGVLTTAAVVIPQEQDARRSMREILDEWLSIFPGTIVRQSSAGTIELVPRVGPDAPEDVALTLTWDDLLALSDGEDDPGGVVNRCRVTSQGWEFTDNQALRAPAFVVSIGGLGIERNVLDSEEVLPDDTAEEFQPGRTIPFTVLVDASNAITVDVVLTAFGSWNRSTASSFGVEGTHSASLTLSVGQSQQVSIAHNSRTQNVTATWRVTRVSSVAIDVEPLTIPSWADNLFGRTYFAYLVEVDVTGTAWVRTNEAVTSEFGRVDQVLPGPDGTDALVTSRAAYGERQASIQSNIFQLTPEQAQNIAQSYVLWNINPRTIRDVQQSEWNKYPVKFDHIGRYVQLPNGEVAVAENRDYTDAFQPLGGAMSATFSATVTEVVIDTETDWLLLDSGDSLQLDSGEMLEVS